jgi:hypothetical protein
VSCIADVVEIKTVVKTVKARNIDSVDGVKWEIHCVFLWFAGPHHTCSKYNMIKTL